MSVLAEEEKTYKSLISSFNSVQAPDVTPNTQITFFNATAYATPLICYLQALFPYNSVKLQSILQNN